MAFAQGDTEGFVRFDTAESAKTALAKADADGKVELVDGDDKRPAAIALITGDEEQALIDKVRSRWLRSLGGLCPAVWVQVQVTCIFTHAPTERSCPL